MMMHHHDDPGTPHLQPLRHFFGSFGALLLLRLDFLQNFLHLDFLICPTCQPVRSWLNLLAL